MSLEGDLRHRLRIGDTVLFYVKNAHGYVFSELSSSRHKSVAVTPRDLSNLSNVHVATFCICTINKGKTEERMRELRQFNKPDPTTRERGVLYPTHKDTTELKKKEGLKCSFLVYGKSVLLQHTLTKKYLAVNCALTSRVENTNLRVELSADSTEACIFKVLPWHQVHSVGDVVQSSDQVKLESTKMEGQFLHCSLSLCGSVGFSELEHCPEINLSAKETAFTIIPHYQPDLKQHSKIFKAGQSVRLFHREHKCYVVAKGSFAQDPVLTEDVHCRKRQTDHGILKERSTSSDTYWQFEKGDNSLSGKSLTWGEECRIKHMPTRCYLSVIDTGNGFKVALKMSSDTALEHDPETVFSLSPVIQEGDQVLVESYARIRHVATRRWLHLEKGKVYKQLSPNCSVPELELDTTELYELTTLETMVYDDTFALELVSEQLLDKFNFVAGIVPVLTTYCARRSVPNAPPLSSAEAQDVASALDDLTSYITEPSNERETKDRQKLLRNLCILEIIISILGMFQPESPDVEEQRVVCRACYKLIKSFLKGDSKKNKNYLAKFVDYFQKYVGLGLNAEDAMIEMMKSNTTIVSKMAETGMVPMLQQVVAIRDPRCLRFFSNLCVCNKRPIPSTQNIILDKLVVAHGKSVFIQLAFGNSELFPEGDRAVVYCRVPRSSDWQPLLDIACKVRVFGLKAPDVTYSSVNLYGIHTVYMGIFLLASFFSLVFSGYFYSLCLLHIIFNHDILRRVLRAISKHGVALLWVGALGVVVLYIYAVISLAFLHESVNDQGKNVLFCDTLGQCFISIVRWGLIGGELGLGVPLVPQQFETSGLRILYDVSFFIIVTTIGLNIVFGIIVDAFSELRNERYHTEQDQKSLCFICSIPSHVFQRQASGFDHHVKEEHNMWNYIYYSVYLETIDISDHNAIEKYVYQKIQSSSIDFFPLFKTLSLEGVKDDADARQLEALQSTVRMVLEKEQQRLKEKEASKGCHSKVFCQAVDEALPSLHIPND